MNIKDQDLPWKTVKKTDNIKDVVIERSQNSKPLSVMNFLLYTLSFALLSAFFLRSVYMLIYVTAVYSVLLLNAKSIYHVSKIVIKFIKECIEQLSKVKILTLNEIIRSSIFVLLAISLIATLIYILDKLFIYLLSLIFVI